VPIKLSKTVSRILFLILIITPVSSFTETAKEPPFTIGETAEKEITYPYSFGDVWETVLKVLQETDKNTKKVLQEKGIKEPLTKILTDKDSGIIIYQLTISGRASSFTSHVFLIKPLESRITQIYSHILNYMFYGSPILNPTGDFHPNGNVQRIFARRLYLTPNEDVIHKKIEDGLKEKTR